MDGGIKRHGGRRRICYCCLSGRVVGGRDNWKSWRSKQEMRNKRKGRRYEGATAMRACKMDRKVD